MDSRKKALLQKLLLINNKNIIILYKIVRFWQMLQDQNNYMVQQDEFYQELSLFLVTVTESSSYICKSIWEKPRTKLFCENDCEMNDDVFFKENFHMSRECFKNLCALLPNLKKMDTNTRKAIPLEKRVAISLYALGSSAEYRSIGNLFGVGKCTVSNILLDFCKEVWEVLQPIFVNYFLLTEDKIKENIKGFQKMGFPQCLGAIC